MLIPTFRIADLQAKIAQVNKRAAKHAPGLAAFVLTVGAESISRHRTDDGRRITVRFNDCELTGPEFKLAGYRFLARIDHNTTSATGGNLVLHAPHTTEGEVPEAFRTAPAHCDHCTVNRNRNDTFILRHEESGAIQQIGRNCLADYIGADAEKIIGWFTGFGRLLADAREVSDFGRTGFSSGAEAIDVLAYTMAAIEAFGWCSKRDSDASYDGDGPVKFSTASVVVDNLLRPESLRVRGTKVQPTDAHYTEAESVLAWARSGALFTKARKSDYDHNLVTILRGEWLDSKTWGFACSAAFVYRRHVERELAARPVTSGTPRPVSVHVGAEKQRLDIAGVQVLGLYPYELNFGITTICRMRDANGNALVWFASADPGMAAGEVVNLRATVKRHGTSKRDGSAETILTRCTVTGTVKPASDTVPERRAA